MKKKLLIPLIILILLIVAGGVFWWWQSKGDISRITYISWDIATGQLSESDVRKAEQIQKAIFQNKILTDPKEIEKRKKSNWELSIQELEVEGDWAFLQGAKKDRETNQILGTGPMPLLAHRVNDHWEAVLLAEEKFWQWLPSVPESLISSEFKEYLIMQYKEE